MLTKLSCDRAKDTGPTRGFVILDDDGSVLIETDVRTVCAAGGVDGADDDRFDDLSLFDDAAGGSLLHATYDDVTDSGIATSRTAENTDAHEFLGTGVVSDFH